MAFWNKKKQESAVDQFIRNNNYVENTGKAPEQMTRKQANAAAQAAHANEVKKEHVQEELQKLRMALNRKDNYGDLADRVTDMIQDLKFMRESNDVEAMRAIDALVFRTIKSVEDQCNRGNYLAVSEYLGVVRSYLNDRASDDVCYYYKDPDFLKFTAEQKRLEVLQNMLQADMIRKQQEMEDLKAQATNPGLKIPKDIVVSKVNKIKQEYEDIKARLSNCENKLKMMSMSLNQIKMGIDNTANQANFDPTMDMDSVLTKKHENEADSTMTDKFINKLGQNNKNVIASTLSVNDNAFASNDASSVELNDDLFKL